MPYRRGAPRGNQNRLVHGRYATATISLRRACRRTLNEARERLADARALGALIGTLESIEAMHEAGVPSARLVPLARALEAALARLEGPKPGQRPWPANNPYAEDLPL